MSASAASGAKDQVGRLLTLVPFLHAHGQVRVDDAARALGIAPDQLLSDLKVLLMCGLPGGYPDDLIDVDLDALEGPEADGVIRVSNADYLARPLRLSPTEATAIIVALRALRSGATDDTREVVDRALAKLEAAAAGGTAAPLIDPGSDTVDTVRAELESKLRDASARGVHVQITYFVPSRDEESERVVDPRGLVRAHGFTYLDAWCHSAEAPRLFRLDRIRKAEVSEQPVVTTSDGPRDLADGLFTQGDDTTLVTLRLQREARWIVEYYPVEAVRSRRGGVLDVDLRIADERWLQRLLLRLAPHAEVLSPTDEQDRFQERARATLSLYRGPA
jgi:proteasome accessory factor C